MIDWSQLGAIVILIREMFSRLTSLKLQAIRETQQGGCSTVVRPPLSCLLINPGEKCIIL